MSHQLENLHLKVNFQINKKIVINDVLYHLYLTILMYIGVFTTHLTHLAYKLYTPNIQMVCYSLDISIKSTKY